MIIIAESGSTKTDWVFIDAENQQKRYSTMGLNPYFTDENTIYEAIKNTLPQIIEQTQLYFYGTGITDNLKAEIVKNGIRKLYPNLKSINTYSDVVAAAKSVLGNSMGVVCILGTGSNSCHWNGKKIDFQIPPLGFWLGDEGSGAHMGKQLVLKYLHNSMPPNIKTLFEIKYGKLDRLDVLSSMKEKPSTYFASYSPFIAENIEVHFIESIVIDSLKEFFEKYLSRYPHIEEETVSFVGSIADIYKKQLLQIAQEKHIKVGEIISKPIDGLVKYHLTH